MLWVQLIRHTNIETQSKDTKVLALWKILPRGGTDVSNGSRAKVVSGQWPVVGEMYGINQRM